MVSKHFKYVFSVLRWSLPNMVTSRHPDSLFWKSVIMTRLPIKFQKNLPNLVLLLLSEQELWRPKTLAGRIAPPPPHPCGMGLEFHNLWLIYKIFRTIDSVRSRSNYQKKSSAPEIKGAANVSKRWVKNSKFKFYHLYLRYLLFYYVKLFSVVSIIWSPEKFTGGTVSLAKFFKMAACSSAKSELRATQLTLKWEKMTKSSVKNNGHSFLELRAL